MRLACILMPCQLGLTFAGLIVKSSSGAVARGVDMDMDRGHYLARRVFSPDNVRERTADHVINFDVVYTSRNLRGLYAIGGDGAVSSEDDDDDDDDNGGVDESDVDGDVVDREGTGTFALLDQVGTGSQVAYITDLKFGDQGPFKVVIDTGSSDTWLVAEKFRCVDDESQRIDNDKCHLGPGYTASSTFKKRPDLHFAIQYGDGEKLLGAVGTETVTVGGVTVPNQRVNIVEDAAWNGDSKTSGLLGLGFPANTANYMGTNATDISRPATYDPFFTSATKAGIVPSGSFAIALQRNADTIDQGFLSFGGLPPVKTYGSTATVRFVPPKSIARGQTEYTIPLNGFRFRGSEATFGKVPPIDGLVDSGTSVLLVPAAIARAYNALWDPKTQDAPPFSVVIGDVEFPLNQEDLRVKNANGYSSAVMPARKCILGDTFMRNVVSVFDVGAGQMRFSSTNPKSGPEQTAPPPATVI